MSVLAGGLAFVGTAEATELISDGSFENTTASSNPVVKVGGKANPGVGEGWSTFSTYLYSTQYTLPGPANSGQAYLRPYPSGTYGITQSSTNVSQVVNLTSGTTLTPQKIDGGNGRYTMSAWFSSYLTQGDYSDLTLEFLNDAGQVVGDPVALGGQEFVANIPTGQNSRYGDAKEWGQDVRTGTIPAGARLARVTIASTSVSGAPDGYVDVVSLDVVDAALDLPTVTAADPANDMVGVGPVVNIAVTIQDRATAVNPSSVRLWLDNAAVSPTIDKVGTNTLVRYAAGLLPALSAHTYQIIYADSGTPPTTQTNEYRFTVADYLTLPAALRTPLGSETANQPGFNVSVFQVATVEPGDTAPVQANLPASIGFSEAVLAGLVGPNLADLSGAASGNRFEVPGVIDWINSSGATANFPNDTLFPGIPGTTGSEDSFVHEIRTFLRFPTAGYYQMGINNEDQFRLTSATGGVQVLRIGAPLNKVVPAVPIGTNITQIQFGGGLPLIPLTAPLIYATPSGNPDDACNLATNPNLSGKIVLVDRGGETCNSAAKALQAQQAGAVAVIEITPSDPGYPFRLDDINPSVVIPVLVIAENFGGSELRTALLSGTALTATIQGDPSPRIAEWDGPKGFGAVDVTFGFAVPAAGVYPMRLVTGHDTGAANLEWFAIRADGSRVLINETSQPDALLAFRERAGGGEPAAFNAPVLTTGGITLSWTGAGVLEVAGTVLGPWQASAVQTNPQTVPASGAMKFYRIRQ